MESINLLSKELEALTEIEIDLDGIKMPFKELYPMVFRYYKEKELSFDKVVFKKIQSFGDGPPPTDQHWMLIGDDYFGVPEDFLPAIQGVLDAATKGKTPSQG